MNLWNFGITVFVSNFCVYEYKCLHNTFYKPAGFVILWKSNGFKKGLLNNT